MPSPLAPSTPQASRRGTRTIGPDGSIAAFAELGVARKVFVHMNNTNPVLRPGSEQRAEAEARGWTIGEDGMEIET